MLKKVSKKGWLTQIQQIKDFAVFKEGIQSIFNLSCTQLILYQPNIHLLKTYQYEVDGSALIKRYFLFYCDNPEHMNTG